MEKAKSAKSPEELITLAKENGTEITPEEAANYFAKLNPPRGDVSDEELKNVAGGGCHNADGRLIVTAWNSCEHWSCIYCGAPIYTVKDTCSGCGKEDTHGNCPWCGHCSAAGQYIVCNHPANHA